MASLIRVVACVSLFGVFAHNGVITQRCEAAPITYVATLSGPAEEPPNASPGSGSAIVVLDLVAHTLRVQLTFQDLIGATTAAHIHGPTAMPGMGTASVITQTPSFAGFPLGVTSGSMDETFDLLMANSYNPAFITANGGTPETAEIAFAAALASGRTYLNIHSTEFPAGEIRGFLEEAPAAVPEPATMGLFALGSTAIVTFRRRRTRSSNLDRS